jgi:hypothetical protein
MDFFQSHALSESLKPKCWFAAQGILRLGDTDEACG